MNIATSPEIRAAMHCCEEPGYGTCASSTPAIDKKSSAARCGALPTPIDAKLYLPGLSLVSAMNSVRLVASGGEHGCLRCRIPRLGRGRVIYALPQAFHQPAVVRQWIVDAEHPKCLPVIGMCAANHRQTAFSLDDWHRVGCRPLIARDVDAVCLIRSTQ